MTNPSRRAAIAALLAALLFLLVAPVLASAGVLSAMVNMLIASLFALSFNLAAGQGGMLSFGHAAFFGVGAFGTVHAMRGVEAGLNIPTPLLPIFGMLTGLIVGIVFGLFATKRTGVYFSMITLAVAELLHSIAPRLNTLFGGEAGISSMRAPWAQIQFGTDLQVYYLLLVWTLAGGAALYLFGWTPLGRVTLAVRDNEQRLRFLGYNVRFTKLVIFSLSAAGSGLAGGMQALSAETANYIYFAVPISAAVVLNTFVGGSGYFLGPVIGAALMVGFSYFLSDVTRLWPLYQGLVFVAVILFLPQGVAGAGAAVFRKLTSEGGRATAIKEARTLVPKAFGICAIGAAFVWVLETLSGLHERSSSVIGIGRVELIGVLLIAGVGATCLYKSGLLHRARACVMPSQKDETVA